MFCMGVCRLKKNHIIGWIDSLPHVIPLQVHITAPKRVQRVRLLHFSATPALHVHGQDCTGVSCRSRSSIVFFRINEDTHCPKLSPGLC